MKHVLSMSISLFFVCACNSEAGKNTDNSPDKVKLAVENYFRSFLQDVIVSEDAPGVISFTDGKTKYSYNTKDIVTGEINENNIPDKIVPVKKIEDNDWSDIEHLVFLDAHDGYFLAGKLEKVYLVKGIFNGVIVVEYTDIAIDSPLYGCKDCRFEKRYKWENNKLITVNESLK